MPFARAKLTTSTRGRRADGTPLLRSFVYAFADWRVRLPSVKRCGYLSRQATMRRPFHGPRQRPQRVSQMRCQARTQRDHSMPYPIEVHPNVRAIASSKIREVANAGLGKRDVLPFWFGEPD